MPRRRKRKHTRLGWLVRHFAPPLVVGGLLGGCAAWLALRERPAPAATAGRPAPRRTPSEEFRWTDVPAPDFPIPPYARFLKDVVVVLDPGHVGQRDPGGTWKRGPTGLREAEVNLRVARFLRELLEAAGARATLTRDADEPLDLPDQEDLRQRAQVANELHADLFLSIHHNANGKPQPNYTSLFFHAAPGYPLASQCAARHLLTGLNDALRLEQHLECAVLDDDVLYKEGLAVLRAADVPAVLSEASFHSNPEEEQRLRDPLYNRREAYGLFIGLARWAQAGLPRVQVVRIDRESAKGPLEALVALDDGLGGRGGWGAERSKIVPTSLVALIDGKPARHTFDAKTGRLRVTLPSDRRATAKELFVDFETTLGQHVLHPRMRLTRKAEAVPL